MCDNCRTGLKVTNRNYTEEAILVVKMVQQLVMHRQNFTLKMVVDVFKGRGVKSKYGINQELVDEFSGQLKHLSDLNLHRLIINLLIRGILEELFISTKINKNNSNTSVYLILGKKFENVLNGKLVVEMSDGVTAEELRKQEI